MSTPTKRSRYSSTVGDETRSKRSRTADERMGINAYEPDELERLGVWPIIHRARQPLYGDGDGETAEHIAFDEPPQRNSNEPPHSTSNNVQRNIGVFLGALMIANQLYERSDGSRTQEWIEQQRERTRVSQAPRSPELVGTAGPSRTAQGSRSPQDLPRTAQGSRFPPDPLRTAQGSRSPQDLPRTPQRPARAANPVNGGGNDTARAQGNLPPTPMTQNDNNSDSDSDSSIVALPTPSRPPPVIYDVPDDSEDEQVPPHRNLLRGEQAALRLGSNAVRKLIALRTRGVASQLSQRITFADIADHLHLNRDNRAVLEDLRLVDHWLRRILKRHAHECLFDIPGIKR